MTENVRGRLYPMGGINNVVTHPTARRKGFARQVLTALFKALYEQGCPFSTLYPFRESFYQRLGFIAFPQPLIAKLDPRNLAPLLKLDLAGRVEHMLWSQGYQQYLDFMAALQPTLHGMGKFDFPIPTEPGENDSWIAFAYQGEQVVGIMIYKLKGDGPGNFEMTIQRFFYLSLEGRYLLLDWIARHIDQAKEAKIWLAAIEQPDSWLPDLELAYEPAWIPGMGRVLNIEQIGGMQVGVGEFSANIQDPFCPWNEGIWRFTAQEGKLVVSRAKNADCDLSIQGLSALVYGVKEVGSFKYHGWGDPPADVQAQMASLFPPMQPHLYEYF